MTDFTIISFITINTDSRSGGTSFTTDVLLLGPGCLGSWWAVRIARVEVATPRMANLGKQRVNASHSADLRVLTEHDPDYTQRMTTG